jgi:hypothetical protein
MLRLAKQALSARVSHDRWAKKGSRTDRSELRVRREEDEADNRVDEDENEFGEDDVQR